jgi:hypothetical protein
VKSAELLVQLSQFFFLSNEVTYWVKTINRNFRTGGLHVVTACPIWEASGEREVKKELAKLHQQLG